MKERKMSIHDIKVDVTEPVVRIERLEQQLTERQKEIDDLHSQLAGQSPEVAKKKLELFPKLIEKLWWVSYGNTFDEDELKNFLAEVEAIEKAGE